MKEINIGDLISLEIKNISREDLEQSFSNFYTEEIGENTIKFRSFQVGDNKFFIKDRPITIKVASVLKKEDKEIFMSLSDNSLKTVNFSSFPFEFIFFFSITFISLGLLVKEIFKLNKKDKFFSPEEIFLSKINSLKEDDFYFKISLALREYIDSKYNLNFLQGKYLPFKLVGQEEINFLASLDYCKFSQDKNLNLSLAKKEALKIFNKLKEDKDVQI